MNRPALRVAFVVLMLGSSLLGPLNVFAARRYSPTSMMRAYQQAQQARQQQLQKQMELVRQQQAAKAAADQHRKDVHHQANVARQAAEDERAQRNRERAALKARGDPAPAKK